ncbi:MAG: glycosyltransferase family 2 protein, partial [Burkholderiales bacterium]|nr:glycosyltransferase family 2 protein [Burkholderiales bacterium]
MNIGVFIPTYNATRDLRYFKRNLEILQQLPDNYQVLFIDSSSRDNTVDLIHQANF